MNASGKRQDRDGTDETAIREQIARYVRSVNDADTALAATVSRRTTGMGEENERVLPRRSSEWLGGAISAVLLD